MTEQDAIAMIRRFGYAEIQTTNQLNSSRGVSKAAEEEARAVSALFAALVGRKPTTDELTQLTSY